MGGLLLCILFFSIFLTTFHFGFFSWAGFSVLVLLLGMLFFLFFLSFFPPQRESRLHVGTFTSKKEVFVSFLPFSFVLLFTLSLFGASGIYQTVFLPSFLLSFLPMFLLPLVISFLSSAQLSENIQKARFFFLFGSALFFRFLAIIASPGPVIDVFTILKEAPLALLSGFNPYDMVYSPVYAGGATNYYAYFPASFLLEAPFVFLFGDPRILLILGDIGSAFLLYVLGRKTEAATLFSLLYLFRPNALFIIEQSWLTPLVFFLTLLSYYLLERKREIWAGIALGVLTSVQPLYSMVALFFLFLFKNIPTGILSYGITVSALVAPFFLWNPTQFIEKTILVYFRPLTDIPTIPVHLSLNVNTAFFTLTGADIPFLFLLSLLMLVTLCIFARLFFLYRKLSEITGIKSTKFRESFHMHLLLSLVLFFYSFYFLFRQSFINYYYLATGFLLLWFTRLFSREKT